MQLRFSAFWVLSSLAVAACAGVSLDDSDAGGGEAGEGRTLSMGGKPTTGGKPATGGKPTWGYDAAGTPGEPSSGSPGYDAAGAPGEPPLGGGSGSPGCDD